METSKCCRYLQFKHLSSCSSGNGNMSWSRCVFPFTLRKWTQILSQRCGKILGFWIYLRDCLGGDEVSNSDITLGIFPQSWMIEIWSSWGKRGCSSVTYFCWVNVRLLFRVNLESSWVDLHIMITLWYLMNLRIILSKLLGIEQFNRDLLNHDWVWHPHGMAACVGSHASKRLNPPSSISSGCRWRNSVAIPCEGTTQRAWKLEIWKVQWKCIVWQRCT